MTEIADAEDFVGLSRTERFTDRLNPILLKEVRQAMRGRFFKISFWITLAVATIVGLGVLMATVIEDGQTAIMGPVFFVAMFSCLALAAQVLVPFSAFLSMGSEWDENTWDLLVLSNLRPRQIVYGKVLSAGVQSLLFYCTFGPFLVFAFLLRGLDLRALFVALAISMFVSLLLSCVAVAMSSFSNGRFARVVLMVLLSVILIWVGIGTVAWGSQLMFRPGQLHDTEMLQAIGAFLSVTLAVAAFFFAATCARLAHPEENRSSGLRITSLVIVVCGLAWATFIMGGNPDDDAMIACTCAAFAFLGVASIFFSTEPERMGRRVVATLPRRRWIAWLATPLLPGGARGLWFFIASGLAVCAWMFLYPNLADRGFEYRRGQGWIPFALLAYGVFYLGLPSGIFAKFADRMAIRVISRIGILILFIASILLPPLIGFLLDIEKLQDFDHPGNVFMMVDDLMSRSFDPAPYMIVCAAAAAVSLVVNGPRLMKSATEMRTALADRAKEAA